MRFSFLFLVLFVSCSVPSAEAPPRAKYGPWSFSGAKAAAAREVYFDYHITFYCHCFYSPTTNSIDPSICGYKPRKSIFRGSRMEWEHVVPAWQFGHFRPCWKGAFGCKGRLCCRKHDQQFKEMEADLHNLVPSVGELNGDRGNKAYGIIPGEPREYGCCDFEVDRQHNVVEINEHLRGDVARIYLYMHKTYPGGLPLTPEQKAALEAASKADPPDAWEKLRLERIRKVQGR